MKWPSIRDLAPVGGHCAVPGLRPVPACAPCGYGDGFHRAFAVEQDGPALTLRVRVRERETSAAVDVSIER